MDAKRTRRSLPPPSPPPPNPNPSRRGGFFGREEAAAGERKHMLAFHFLRALSRIHREATPVTRRTRTIRRAAYSSMARAASPRRAWSRALLGQARARRSRAMMRRAVLVRRRRVVVPASARPPAAPPSPVSAAAAARADRIVAAGETSTAAAATRALPLRQPGEPQRADALRRLVPGGAGMEYCSLLEETADYLRSLRAQVQLMQSLVDLYSCQ
ncbi:transcription factor IBH1-like [Oryza brachyantha]|uniref:transcription factor IBH1-like n=1 Tax=Oryza brachyantha TaxID=4533 RepID=UPI001ADB19D5|nr:transcription factor IBH1-like [Oryza brachyantha]